MKNIIVLILISTSLFSRQNIFIIKNRDGTVLTSKKIEHKRNKFFDFFDELSKIEQIASSKMENREDISFNNQIIKEAKKYLGGKYIWGGTTPKGFDCSGYVKYIYKKAGINLPRTAYEQSMVGKPVDKINLRKGDLLFFLTDKKRNLPITHVGLYLGNDKFIHAASRKKGIIISKFSTSRYNRYFVKARRVIY